MSSCWGRDGRKQVQVRPRRHCQPWLGACRHVTPSSCSSFTLAERCSGRRSSGRLDVRNLATLLVTAWPVLPPPHASRRSGVSVSVAAAVSDAVVCSCFMPRPRRPARYPFMQLRSTAILMYKRSKIALITLQCGTAPRTATR